MSFTNLKELIETATEEDKKIYQLMLETESEYQKKSIEDLRQAMADQFDVMVESVRKGTKESAMSQTGITGGDGHRLYEYVHNAGVDSLVNPDTLEVAANAMAVNEVNAAMGRIVATPTAGSAGILPAVITHMYDTGKYEKDELVNAMFTSSALGLTIANQACIAGAEGGCQAEIGSATAMAAGALVELKGGTPDQVGHALGLALKNSLGLVCDPVAGLVEVPCIIRNGLHAITALAAADMALAGVKSVIPADEVIGAMYDIGKEMPASLRETGIGGLAGTPTGKSIKEEVFGSRGELEMNTKTANYKSAYDIIGPVMVGPSSSHTAGAARIGNLARQLLGEEPEEVIFSLMDSFAKTYQGHGTDRALIGGVLGYDTFDPNIADAEEMAEKAGLKYHFLEADFGNYHPNTVLVDLWGANNYISVIASSIGGGKIEAQKIGEYDIKFSGERPTIFVYHKDKVGVIAKLTDYLADKGFNISFMMNQRQKINGPAISVFEVDTDVSDEILDDLKKEFPDIEKLQYVNVN